MIFLIFGALSLCAGLHIVLFSQTTDLSRLFDFSVILATQFVPFWLYRSPAASPGPEIFKVVTSSVCTDLAFRGPTDLALISPPAASPSPEAPDGIVMSTCTDLAIRGPTDLADISRVPKALAVVPPAPFIGPLPVLCFHAFSIRLDDDDLAPTAVLTHADAPLPSELQFPDNVYTSSYNSAFKVASSVTTHVTVAVASTTAYIVYVILCTLFPLAPFAGPTFRHIAGTSRRDMISPILQFIQTHAIICVTVLEASSRLRIQSEVSLFLVIIYQVMLWYRVSLTSIVLIRRLANHLQAFCDPDDPHQPPTALSLVDVDAEELERSDHVEEHHVGPGLPAPSDDTEGERITSRATIEPARIIPDPPIEVQVSIFRFSQGSETLKSYSCLDFRRC